MNPLSLHCHKCNQAFLSGAYVDPCLARSLPIDGIVYQCPRCRLRDTYVSEEQTPWAAEGVSDPQRDLQGASGSLSSSHMPVLRLGLWVGILIGVLLTVLATGLMHAVNAGVLSVIP